jgi:hypothetical protein
VGVGDRSKGVFQQNLVWFIDPDTRTAGAYSGFDQSVELAGDQDLDGGIVLPGFTLTLQSLFSVLDN